MTATVDSATHTINRDSSTQAWRISARALVLSPAASAFWRSSRALPNSSVRMLPATFQAHQIGSSCRLWRVRMFCSGRSRLRLRRLARLPQIAIRIAVGQGGGERQTENLRAGLQHFAHGLRPGRGIQILWHAPILKDDRAAHDFGFARAGHGAPGAGPGTAEPGCGNPAGLRLNVPRVRLKSHPEEPRTPADLERYLALIERRAQGEPLAYITGMREFWTLELRVTRDVLVPRPETELLVERALALCTAAAARVADLGTGSGAIALALAAERPAWEMLAIDASAAALAIARDNARRLGLTTWTFESSNWFSGPRRPALRPGRQQSALRGRPRPGAAGPAVRAAAGADAG